MSLGNPSPESRHRRLCLRQRHSVLHARDRVEPVHAAAIHVRLRQIGECPQITALGASEMKVGWQDTDDRVWRAAKGALAPNDLRIATELALPEDVSEHGHAVADPILPVVKG